MIYSKCYKTILGDITFLSNDKYLLKLQFGNFPRETSSSSLILDNAYAQLNEYLIGRRKYFDIPFLIEGSSFQEKVLTELCKIPYGEVCSYKEIAKRINNEKAYRAIGLANNKNPLPIIIPCHRVIGSNGKLVGYAGGLHIKQFLLNLEQRFMKKYF